ncbi:MAG: YibE/F family protein [Candidatus Riflebacteria bacterium]|nr:YibE/F family protein [Candidatus Riflebacteria bacterium]
MKANVIIVIAGLVFMSAILFYVFGDTQSGIYSIAEIKYIEEAEHEETELNDKVYIVELEHVTGDYKGQRMVIDHFETEGSVYKLNLKPGDIVLAVVEKQEDQLIVGIDEHYKSRKIMGMAVFLLFVIALISGVNGVKAMLALFFTLIMIFGVMTHYLLAGFAPLPLTIICAAVIVLVSILIIAGFTKKALIAGIGTLCGVVLAGFFGWSSAIFLNLSGYSGDETTYLQILNSNVDLKGILVSGIIIGALGAVMDVSISIASSLKEIFIANPDYTKKEMFKSGMNIGRDIIGSMVNTLILAYTGASLSLILVFSMQREDFPLIKIMNMEFICTEVVRSLAGLFGMVLAIPITAFVGSIIYLHKDKRVV